MLRLGQDCQEALIINKGGFLKLHSICARTFGCDHSMQSLAKGFFWLAKEHAHAHSSDSSPHEGARYASALYKHDHEDPSTHKAVQCCQKYKHTRMVMCRDTWLHDHSNDKKIIILCAAVPFRWSLSFSLSKQCCIRKANILASCAQKTEDRRQVDNQKPPFCLLHQVHHWQHKQELFSSIYAFNAKT